MQRLEGEKIREYPMYSLDPDNHPGWQIHERLSVETIQFGAQDFHIIYQTFPVEDVPGADAAVMPEFGGFDEYGTFTQDGDLLVMSSPSFHFECTRRIRPTNPGRPSQQQEFACVDRDGVESVWWGILWIEGISVRPECLAEHAPPELPTRWSLWERTDEDGTSTFSHREYEEDGRSFTSTLHDLVLRQDGTARMIGQQTRYFAETDRLSWPSRSETDLTWTQQGESLSIAGRDGLSLECDYDYDIDELGDSIRTFALACEGSDGVRTWWVPMDMTWPWGWGTHDTPHGWWWESQ